MNPGVNVRRQQGVVMLIALIMLLAVTLMVVTSSNLMQADLKVVQNAESREQTRSAAIAAIEEAISSPDANPPLFLTSPKAMFRQNCNAANQKCYYDSNGNLLVTVQLDIPTCVAVTPIKNGDLDVFNSRQQASCYLPSQGGGANAVYSMCGNAVWELRATATDAVTGAKVFVRQGVSIMTSLNNVDTICPLPGGSGSSGT
jgi:hypothetical protein